jgi:aminomethyltransferase
MEPSDTALLKKTPLYKTHLGLGAKIAPFGGWLMPIQYEGILAEHAHTRTKASIFDICHMGEFTIRGDPASTGLDRILTQNIISMPVGSCRYGFMLNEAGGIIDDLVVYRIADKEWMLVVNAATIDGDEASLRKNLRDNCELKNVSDSLGKLDIQGPLSGDVMSKVFGSGIKSLKYYNFGEFDLWGEKCIVSRTGYTGELGYEVYISADNVVKLWDLILGDGMVKPAGLGSRDTLRLEMGYPLCGQDIDAAHTPLAASLEKFVDMSKEFMGKGALINEKKAGPKEKLVCFKSDSRRAPRHGFGIYDGPIRVGTVTSGSFSPSLSVGIGMGYIKEKLDIGTKLLVKDQATEIPVVIVPKPFYAPKKD